MTEQDEAYLVKNLPVLAARFVDLRNIVQDLVIDQKRFEKDLQQRMSDAVGRLEEGQDSLQQKVERKLSLLVGSVLVAILGLVVNLIMQLTGQQQTPALIEHVVTWLG